MQKLYVTLGVITLVVVVIFVCERSFISEDSEHLHDNHDHSHKGHSHSHGDHDHHGHRHDDEDNQNPFIEVKYMGETFLLNRESPGYTPKQAAKIDEIIVNTKPIKTFTSYRDLVDYSAKLQAPGLGGSNGMGDETKYGQFVYFSANLDAGGARVFIYKTNGLDHPFNYFDSFVNKRQSPNIYFNIDEAKKEVVFSNYLKEEIARKKLP